MVVTIEDGAMFFGIIVMVRSMNLLQLNTKYMLFDWITEEERAIEPKQYWKYSFSNTYYELRPTYRH